MRTIIYSIAIVLSLSTNTLAQASEVDPGEKAFDDICRACHQKNGMGIQGMQAPSIAGLPRWYVSGQLRKFLSGERGGNKADASGHLMYTMVHGLSDRNIALLGRYVQKRLSPNTNRRVVTAGTDDIVTSGQQIYQQQCQSCHGEQGGGDRTILAPPLTFQQDWYLISQLEKFQQGVRTHSDRQSVPSLDSQKSRAVSAYLSSLVRDQDG